MTLEVEDGLRQRRPPRRTSGQLFLPGLLFMSLLFAAQGMSVDIWIEKTRGTLRRTLSHAAARRVVSRRQAARRRRRSWPVAVLVALAAGRRRCSTCRSRGCRWRSSGPSSPAARCSATSCCFRSLATSMRGGAAALDDDRLPADDDRRIVLSVRGRCRPGWRASAAGRRTAWRVAQLKQILFGRRSISRALAVAARRRSACRRRRSRSVVVPLRRRRAARFRRTELPIRTLSFSLRLVHRPQGRRATCCGSARRSSGSS